MNAQTLTELLHKRAKTRAENEASALFNPIRNFIIGTSCEVIARHLGESHKPERAQLQMWDDLRSALSQIEKAYTAQLVESKQEGEVLDFLRKVESTSSEIENLRNSL